mmetsp:Transcript_72335/g.209404  ORF Transcript_72335/g.209404 Transcript_72335/m.209404 type:complete len:230 (-) Transcript_72335:650-1339(-)
MGGRSADSGRPLPGWLLFVGSDRQRNNGMGPGGLPSPKLCDELRASCRQAARGNRAGPIRRSSASAVEACNDKLGIMALCTMLQTSDDPLVVRINGSGGGPLGRASLAELTAHFSRAAAPPPELAWSTSALLPIPFWPCERDASSSCAASSSAVKQEGGLHAMMPPSLTTMTRSARFMYCNWCVTKMRVVPRSSPRSEPKHSSIKCFETCMSTAESGSSRMKVFAEMYW